MVMGPSGQSNEAAASAFRTTRRRVDMNRQAMQTTRIRAESFSLDEPASEEEKSEKRGIHTMDMYNYVQYTYYANVHPKPKVVTSAN